MQEAGGWRRQLEEGWESRVGSQACVYFPAAQSSWVPLGLGTEGAQAIGIETFRVSTVSSISMLKLGGSYLCGGETHQAWRQRDDDVAGWSLGPFPRAERDLGWVSPLPSEG